VNLHEDSYQEQMREVNRFYFNAKPTATETDTDLVNTQTHYDNRPNTYFGEFADIGIKVNFDESSESVEEISNDENDASEYSDHDESNSVNSDSDDSDAPTEENHPDAEFENEKEPPFFRNMQNMWDDKIFYDSTKHGKKYIKFSFLDGYLRAKFKSSWSPHQFVAIDECLVLFKGRWIGRQHIRGKPHATGLKMFMICDEEGYVIDWWLYRGKYHSHNRGTKHYELVMDFLLDNLKPEDNHIAVADSYFGGLKLVDAATQEGFQVICTNTQVRPSFIYKENLMKQVKKKGDVAYLVHEEKGTLCCVHYDSKRVCFTSNCTSARVEENSEHNPKSRPYCSVLYNLNMGFVGFINFCNIQIILILH